MNEHDRGLCICSTMIAPREVMVRVPKKESDNQKQADDVPEVKHVHSVISI